MSAPFYPAHGHAFPDVSFHQSNFGQSPSPFGSADDHRPMQTIDFSTSQAYFGHLDEARSPPHAGPSHHASSSSAYSHGRDNSPSALSGHDPVSKLGFTSGRSLPRQPDANAFYGTEAAYSAYPFNGAATYPANSPPAPYSYQVFSSGAHPQPIAHPPMNDAAHRTAEVERRNRLREEEKTRRSLAIQKQVDDGMAAFQLEKDQAAHRSAEVERRNKAREEEKIKRRVAIQKQVEDGIKAIKLEKERARSRVEADRQECRKWLSTLPAAGLSVSSSSRIDVYEALGRQMRGFWESSRPAASGQAQRQEVIADVQRAINSKWPGQGLKVAAFGSSVTGLITNSSDLDLVLLDPTRPFGVGTPSELCVQPNTHVRHSGGMPEWYSTNQVANAIRASSKFRSIVPISSASVPIVKMVHRKHGIPADININERFGLFNSQLICAYADLQPDLVRPLIFFLKHWYGQRELNDPAGKRGNMTFSSYTIALMALQVLQIEGVLPNLQSPHLLRSLNVQPSFLYSRAKRPRARRGNNRSNGGAVNDANPDAAEDTALPQKYNVTFASKQVDIEPHRKKALELAKGDDSDADARAVSDRLLGKMLVAFVRFYSQLDRRTQAVSVVKGCPLRRRCSSQPGHVFFDSASDDGDTELKGPNIGKVTNHLQFAPADAEKLQEVYDEETDVWSGDEMVVQDPFIIDRNTSRNIKSKAIERWQSEMQRALELLGVSKAGNVRKVTPENAPLILDLCIPQNVLIDMEAEGSAVRGSAEVGIQPTAPKPTEPWRPEEEAAAKEREIAKQAAKELRREKKKSARRSKRGEARRLQEEAAMVEDMIDGIDAGRVTGFMNGNQSHEIWRLRVDDDKESTPIPFTFSVARSPGQQVASPNGRSSAAQRAEQAKDATVSPTASIGTTRTDASSSSEDIDLVALRLEQSTRMAQA